MRKVLSLPRLTRTLPSGLIPPPWPALASMVYRVVPVLPPEPESFAYCAVKVMSPVTVRSSTSLLVRVIPSVPSQPVKLYPLSAATLGTG